MKREDWEGQFVPDHRTFHMPFGWNQGDPLVVCQNDLQIREVSKAFQFKAYYCRYCEMIGGRRFSKMIFFHPGPLSDMETVTFRRWKDEVIGTKLWPYEPRNIFNV